MKARTDCPDIDVAKLLRECAAWKKAAQGVCRCSNWGGRWGGKNPCPNCKAETQALELEAERLGQ